MLEPLKKVLNSLLGAVAISPDELREIVDRLVAEGALSPEDGERLLRALLYRSRKEKDDFAERLDREVRRLVELIPLVSRPEFRRLEARVGRLEARLCVPDPAPGPAENATSTEDG